jgi:hypothetical protein
MDRQTVLYLAASPCSRHIYKGTGNKAAIKPLVLFYLVKMGDRLKATSLPGMKDPQLRMSLV